MQLDDCHLKIPTTRTAAIGWEIKPRSTAGPSESLAPTTHSSPHPNSTPSHAPASDIPISCDPPPLVTTATETRLPFRPNTLSVSDVRSNADGLLAYCVPLETDHGICTSSLTSILRLRLVRKKRWVLTTSFLIHHPVRWLWRLRVCSSGRYLRRFIIGLPGCAQQVRCGIQSAMNARISVRAKVRIDGTSLTSLAVSHLTPCAHSSHLRPYNHSVAWIDRSSRRGVGRYGFGLSSHTVLTFGVLKPTRRIKGRVYCRGPSYCLQRFCTVTLQSIYNIYVHK